MATERWTVTGPQTIELDGVSALSVRCVDGRVDVVAHDEPVTRIEVHSVDGRPLEVSLDDDGRLVVGHETLSGWKAFFENFSDFTGRARADLQVAVPRGTPVSLGMVRGEALLAGTSAKARVHTVSGSALVTDVHGPLDVNTVSGEVTVRDLRGDIHANSVSADLTVTGVVPAVDISTVSGTVTLDLHEQPRTVRCNAVSGSFVIRVPDPGTVRAKLTGVGGRLVVGGVEASGFGTKTLGAAAPAATTLEANVVTGDVTVLGAPAGAR
ncbi:hypothetical protein ET495_08630 [Xylanimonas allomyrinae]|uniref:DUF4097 domain-containing protein n=1 Tax=Xylanimonas allomyrinae TaxID=2509459 RepID=A0A4V0YE82_9MICO|nr:DUF4097 family beta strand repeat-containing protein [Xylanimonas allomyrinae]QAY63301.1 hypothetical protein ET495_08630 [Xylanimonas allomyrinae]